MQNFENKNKKEDMNKDKKNLYHQNKLNTKNNKYCDENQIFSDYLPEDNIQVIKPIPIKSHNNNFLFKKRANRGLFPYINSFKNNGDIEANNNCVFKSQKPFNKYKIYIPPPLFNQGYLNINENYYNMSKINLEENQRIYKPPQIKINVIINNFCNTENSLEGKNGNNKKIFGVLNNKNKLNNTEISKNKSFLNNTINNNKSQDENHNSNKNNISKKFEIIKADNLNENLNYNEIKKIPKNKKRGRKAKKQSARQHNALDQDNIIRKIQVHFLSFIIYFCNDLIQTLLPNNKDLCFKNIQYELKKTVNHAYIEKLKSKKIGDILQLTASPKNKKFDGDINKRSYEKICSINPFLKHFFEMSYLDMFNNYYCRKEREIEIEGYKVKLSQRARLFIDLIAKNENSEEKIKEIAEQYFINKKKNINPIFVIDKK